MEKVKKPEFVTIIVPKEKGITEDKIVVINEHTYQIQRGKPVTVPMSVARQLEHEAEMLDLIDRKKEGNRQKLKEMR